MIKRDTHGLNSIMKGAALSVAAPVIFLGGFVGYTANKPNKASELDRPLVYDVIENTLGIKDARGVSLETAVQTNVVPEIPQVVYEPTIYELPEDQKTQENVNLLIEAVYAEARNLYTLWQEGKISEEDFHGKIEVVAGSLIIRSLEGDKTIEGILSSNKNGEHVYSYRNSNDPGKEIVGNAYEHAQKNKADLEAYLAIEDKVGDIVENGTESFVNHYFVRAIDADKSTFPNWAFSNGKLIKPDYELVHGSDITRGYWLNYKQGATSKA